MQSSVVLVLVAVLACSKASEVPRTKANFFEPTLSSNAYVGRMQENERLVQLEPRLYASDADPSNTANGQVCGYELSLHKHDESLDETSAKIPFVVEMKDGEAVMKLKSNINQLDCEVKRTYRLFIRAYDCADAPQRRYSERSSLIITLSDVNEYAPVFTHKNYLFKLHQEQSCSSCRVEATDDDCNNVDHRVCDYQITTPNVPFAIDSNGSISIVKPLDDDNYEFEVVAVDCFSAASETNSRLRSEPAKVTIKIVKSCKPTITDSNPSKLTIQSDHTHLFDTIHLDTCDETCAVDSLTGIVTLDSNGIDSGCNAEQCAPLNHQYVLIAKDDDSTGKPPKEITSFDGIEQAVQISKEQFSGDFKNEFTIQMWMKHADQDDEEKEHIFCKSDAKLKNRHHSALFLQNGYLKLLLRRGPLLSNDKNFYLSEWKWKVSQINDGQWHSYKLVVQYPDKIDLYIDDELFPANDDNFQIVEDYALTTIEGTDGTVFTVGACWHGRVGTTTQHFHGELSGLVIEQKEELDPSTPCLRECQQYLDMPDIEPQAGTALSSNSNRSIWTLRSDSSESFEQLLKHVVYRNTFEPLGPSGQRILTLQTTLKCLGENYTYDFPVFTRRLAIDEVLRPANIELKGSSIFLLNEQQINQGVAIFRNLSVWTDNVKREQVDLTQCSINTTPDLESNEKLVTPDEYLQSNSLDKGPTKTGLILSGSANLDVYQSVLQQIVYISQSPIQYYDRAFSLVCMGAQDHFSTNEFRVEIRIEQPVPPPAPVASILSNKLYVDNDDMRDNFFDVEGPSAGGFSGWPIAVVVCVSVSVAGVLVLYLVTRLRSANKQRNQLAAPGDDTHSQMEWEDDIGLNIIVNPLEESKKPVQAHQLDANAQEYEGTTSEEDDYDGHSQNDYSSEDEEDDEEDEDEEEDYYDHNQIHSRKHEHQLEWDDEAIEYGPKKV